MDVEVSSNGASTWQSSWTDDPGSVYEVPQNVAQASSGRDALSKALYNNLFEWIVGRVNVSMKPQGTTDYVIGVLDI